MSSENHCKVNRKPLENGKRNSTDARANSFMTHFITWCALRQNMTRKWMRICVSAYCASAPRAELLRAGGQKAAKILFFHPFPSWHETLAANCGLTRNSNRKGSGGNDSITACFWALFLWKTAVFQVKSTRFMNFAIFEISLWTPTLSISRFFTEEGAAVPGK